MKSLFPALFALAANIILFGNGMAYSQDLGAIGRDNPFKAGGSVSLRLVGYSADGIFSRREPFSYIVSGNLNLSLYDLSIPLSFTYSEQDRNFSQPFNKFGMSPKYGWATGHFGYRSLNFSPYTLAGHQILGGGFEINPGNFRLAFMYGQFNRAVDIDTGYRFLQNPAYERTGYSARIGYGSEMNHIDVIVLKAEDDPNSLKSGLNNNYLLQPAENLVVGLSGKANLFDKLNLQFDAAISDYTRNLLSDGIGGESDPGVEALSGVIEPRISTQVYTAVNAKLNYYSQYFSIVGGYSRVSPDYKSMGAYYIYNDQETYNFAPSFYLFDRKLALNANLTYQTDNLQNKKMVTTTRLTPILNVNYNHTPYLGINVQYMNMLTDQSEGNLPLTDSMKMSYSNPSITISPRYLIADSLISHSFFATATFMEMINENKFFSQYSNYTNLSLSFSYSLNFIKPNLSFTASLSSNRLDNYAGIYLGRSASLAVNKGFLQNTLNFNGSLALSFQQSANVYNGGVGATYRIGDHHNLDFQLFAMQNISTNNKIRFSELTAIAGYVYNF